jgi:membrane fusion protein (multidrug efflux system)
VKFRRASGRADAPERRLRHGRGQAAAAAPPVRRIRWSRWILLSILVVAAAWYLLTGQATVVAQGVVNGDTTRVAAISRGRILSADARCGDTVQSGQVLAAVGNEERLLEIDARYENLSGELQGARAETGPALRQARERAAAAYRALEAARTGLADAQEERATYMRLFDQRAITQTKMRNAEERYQDALAARDIAVAEWQEALAAYDRTESELFTTVELLRAQLNEVDALRQRATRTVLTAPASGTIARCEAAVGEVVEAGEALFEVFGTDSAHILAYLDPKDVRRIALGLPATLTINGLPGRYAGRVTAILPLVEELPPALRRYFWQDEEWQQYAPVRIDLRGLGPAQRRQLSFGTRADVTIEVWNPGFDLQRWLPF